MNTFEKLLFIALSILVGCQSVVNGWRSNQIEFLNQRVKELEQVVVEQVAKDFDKEFLEDLYLRKNSLEQMKLEDELGIF